MLRDIAGIRLCGANFDEVTNILLLDPHEGNKVKPVKGTLLYGRNGAGKSTLAKAVRKAKGESQDTISQAEFLSINNLPIELTEEEKSHVFVFDEEYIDKNVKFHESGLDTIIMLGHQVEIAEQLQEAQKNLEKAKGEFDIQEKTIIENEKIECKNSPKYHIKKMRLALQGDDCWAGRDKLIKNNRQNTGVRDDTYKQFITLTTTKTRDQLIIELLVFEAAIDLLSFIQLFPKDWKKRSYLSLGGISSVALMTFLSERPQITSVFLCLDNDQAGNEACEKLAGEISEGYSVIRLKPSRKDWNEILCDKNADRKKAIAETITIKVPETEELVPMLCYEDIEQTSVEWLWFPYIPFGKLTIVQGNPGEGKTYFAMMLTAACTNRKLFPNMEDIEPFNVIYQTAEDGMGDTIKPRLVEAGANLSKVMVIDGSEEALTLSDDRIEKAVRQNHVRLVIIDQVQAFIGADVDMNRANEVRPVFRKLGMIAEKTGCAIVLIGHLNKSSGTQSTYRGLGSIDIMAAVRSLIFIGKVRKDPTTRVLIHEKSSLAPPGETMAFKLGDEEGFRWVGAYEISADELLDGKEGKATETKLERGTKLIKELLADKKEISIRELDEKAKEQGISGRTMRDVRSRMKNELEYRVNEKQENSIRLKE